MDNRFKPPTPPPIRKIQEGFTPLKSTAFIDWMFRLGKYICLVLATFSMQHTLFVLAIFLVIIASLCDYFAQILLIRREVE